MTTYNVGPDAHLQPVQLNHLFAMLDPCTGTWDARDDHLRRTEISGRCMATMRCVYERLQRLEEITCSDYGYYLMSRSFTCLEEYQKNVVTQVRKELGQHIRYVRAIGDKVKARLTERWQYLTNIPVIGALFAFVRMQIQWAFTRNLKTVLQILEEKHKTFYCFEERLETAKHIIKLFTEDKIMVKAFKDYDKREAEKELYALRRDFPEEKRTFFFLRKDPQNIEGFILTKLDDYDGAKVEHHFFVARRVNSTAYVYILRSQPQQKNSDKITTFETLRALKHYLNDLQKKK